MKISRNRCNSLKTKGRRHFYSTIIWRGRRNRTSLNFRDPKTRKTGAVEPLIHREQGKVSPNGMRADEKVGEDFTRAWTAVPPSAARMGLKREPSQSPDGLVQIPVHRDSCVREKVIEKLRGSRWKRQKLRVHRSRHHHPATPRRRLQRGRHRGIGRIVRVPKRNKNVRVNRGGHRPRILRMYRRMAFLPDGTPGFPIPLNFSNRLSVRTGVTRTAAPSCSKIRLSPGRSPSARRISCGTVICPLLVIRAFLFRAPFFISLLYHIAPYFCGVWRLVSRLQRSVRRKRLPSNVVILCRVGYSQSAAAHPQTERGTAARRDIERTPQ